MGRLGWPARSAEGQVRAADAIATVAGLPGLELAGVFTHFAGADEPDLASAREQWIAFQAVLSLLEAAGVRPRLRHAANSAAILRLPETHLDLCRAGIGLYGYAEHPGLRPVLSWYTRVAMVKALAAGDAVSYGGTYVARGPETVATLPVGYADGWRRALGNSGHVLLGGAPAPIRGRVCMDQMVVSCADAGGVRQGDLAVLLGAQDAATQWADALAAALGTISYEVLCAVHPRVPRRYLPA
jgi:alanine racemase